MSDTHAHEEHHDPVPIKTYGIIGGILLGGTALAYVFADALELSWLATIFLIFGIASFKVSLVALYFMHLKFEKGWKYILCVPPLILFVIMLMALTPDIAKIWGGIWAAYG